MHTQISPTRLQRLLIAVVVVGAMLVAGIAFVGSYAAVQDLAQVKGFGTFSTVFPIGIDAGILVTLSLDVLLTWLRCPFPLLRHTAWLLTGATITFNAAVLWPDPVGTAMHAVLPVIFTVTVEAARHSVGRLADITADRHIEAVRVARWFLSPMPTFKLWRGMHLWNRPYQSAVKAEQDRLIYIEKLKRRHGMWWRFKASSDELLPLRLAALGVPLPGSAASTETVPTAPTTTQQRPPFSPEPSTVVAARPLHSVMVSIATEEPVQPLTDQPTSTGTSAAAGPKEVVTVLPEPPRPPAVRPTPVAEPAAEKEDQEVTPAPVHEAEREAEPPSQEPVIAGTGATRAEALYAVFAGLADRAGKYPSMPSLSKVLFEEHGITGRNGRPMSADSLRRYRTEWTSRYEREMTEVSS